MPDYLDDFREPDIEDSDNDIPEELIFDSMDPAEIYENHIYRCPDFDCSGIIEDSGNNCYQCSNKYCCNVKIINLQGSFNIEEMLEKVRDVYQKHFRNNCLLKLNVEVIGENVGLWCPDCKFQELA